MPVGLTTYSAVSTAATLSIAKYATTIIVIGILMDNDPCIIVTWRLIAGDIEYKQHCNEVNMPITALTTIRSLKANSKRHLYFNKPILDFLNCYRKVVISSWTRLLI